MDDKASTRATNIEISRYIAVMASMQKSLADIQFWLTNNEAKISLDQYKDLIDIRCDLSTLNCRLINLEGRIEKEVFHDEK